MDLLSEILNLSQHHDLLSAWTCLDGRLLLSNLFNLIFLNACYLSSLFLFLKFLAFVSAFLEIDNVKENLDEFLLSE
jgi:hypothetical protein